MRDSEAWLNETKYWLSLNNGKIESKKTLVNNLFTRTICNFCRYGVLCQNKAEYVYRLLCAAESQPDSLENKHPESPQILLWSVTICRQEENSEITFGLLGSKSGLISTAVYEPDLSAD